MYKIYTIFLLICFTAFLTHCTKKTDEFQSDQLNDYLNLKVGKYIIYKLDSTKFVNFGQKDTIIKYQAKDVIDAPVTDNLGRPGWRVIRYLRDSASANDLDWKPNSTYMITVTRETAEVIEDNLRYQKLKLPINTPGMEAHTKIRYKSPGSISNLYPENSGLRVRFYENVKSIAPGQSAVFYDGDDVIGGGIIYKAALV